MKPAKKKAPQVAAGGALTDKHSKSKFSGASTCAKAQQVRIVAARRGGPKTTDDLRKLGCCQVSARIPAPRHLRNLDIGTELFDGYAADGNSRAHMARFTLVGEPEGGAAC